MEPELFNDHFRLRCMKGPHSALSGVAKWLSLGRNYPGMRLGHYIWGR